VLKGKKTHRSSLLGLCDDTELFKRFRKGDTLKEDERLRKDEMKLGETSYHG
jgi:hypothetical protein